MPNKITIPAGSKFGRLTVLEEDPERRRPGDVRFRCRCDCGTIKSVPGGSLRKGHTLSCGCWQRERASKVTGARNTKHGHADRTAEYRIWNHLRNRCFNRRNRQFAHYGGRGITVCPQWSDFAVFYRDMGPRPSPKHSIDRIDVNGDYEPSNCRWATPHEQARNKRTSFMLTFEGRTMAVAAWSEETGLGSWTIIRRYFKGWPMEKVLTTPSRQARKQPA